MVRGIVPVVMEGPWTIVGAIAAIVAAIGVIVSGARVIWRRHRLKTPCKAWFSIPSLDQRTINYAVQDHREHYVEEMVLSTNSEVEIEILYRSSISFGVSAIYFGCNEQNDLDLDTKPIIKSIRSSFIERGTAEESPETRPDTNLTDRHKYYHIRRPKSIARTETYPLGFKIQTRKAGKYRFRLFFSGEEVGTIKNNLFIIVEEKVTTRMRCTSPKHRWTGCFIQPLTAHD
jgi:hypothetical protein